MFWSVFPWVCGYFYGNVDPFLWEVPLVCVFTFYCKCVAQCETRTGLVVVLPSLHLSLDLVSTPRSLGLVFVTTTLYNPPPGMFFLEDGRKPEKLPEPFFNQTITRAQDWTRAAEAVGQQLYPLCRCVQHCTVYIGVISDTVHDWTRKHELKNKRQVETLTWGQSEPTRTRDSRVNGSMGTGSGQKVTFFLLPSYHWKEKNSTKTKPSEFFLHNMLRVLKNCPSAWVGCFWSSANILALRGRDDACQWQALINASTTSTTLPHNTSCCIHAHTLQDFT